MSKIALVIFALILAACTPQTTTTTTTTGTITPTPTETDVVLPAGPTAQIGVLAPVTITLSEQSESGLAGTALVEDYGDKTRITITLTGTKDAVSHPANIHTGFCASPTDVAYILNEVVDGKSDTIVGVRMSTLFLDPNSIIVNKSATEVGVYTSCGDLK